MKTVIPNQLKKSNKCDVENIMGKVDSENAFKIEEPTNVKVTKDYLSFFEVISEKENLFVDDLINLNLINIYKDIQINEIQVIENFVKNNRFIKNSIMITKELSESEILLEFGKKIQGSNTDKNNDEMIFDRLIKITHILGIMLFTNIYFFNEQKFESELRTLGSIIRNVLPFIYYDNTKSNSELFWEVFYHCLGSVKIIVNVNNIQEMCSTQVIMNLISVFSIEEISAKIILLVIDIIVHLFIRNSINSIAFVENTLNSIFNVMEGIPKSLKSLKKARICIDLDFSMHYYVYLIIRIIQGICIPNDVVLSNDFDSNKQNSIKYHSLAKSICNQFSTFFINKLIFNRVKNKDYHYSTGNDIAAVIFLDMLKASLNPKYYICSTIITVILVQLIKISNSLISSNSNSKINLVQIDTYSKELCIYLLGISLSTFLKNINYNISLNGISGNNNDNLDKVHDNRDIHNTNTSGEIDCICDIYSFNSDFGDKIGCKICDKMFHYNCISDNTYSEINEDWKCDDCVINDISNELNKSMGNDSESISDNLDNSKIHVIVVITLDYLYRKTGLNTSPTKFETINRKRIVTDVNSSVICSFILEMESKLKLFDLNNTKECGKLHNLKANKNKNIERNDDGKKKLFLMLVKEWFSPVTNVHSSLVTYSSKFPKLLDSCTIRIWNNYLLKEIKALSSLVLHCLLANIYNSSLSTMRRIALNSLGQVISVKPSLLSINNTVLNAILLSLKDKTPKIRERALVIIEKYVSDIYSIQILGNKDKFEDENKLLLNQIIRTTFDISPLVRLASIKILKIIYSKNPTNLYIGSLLLKRALASDETQSIKRLSIDTFISLWFCNTSVINEKMGSSLVEIINYSESKDFNQSVRIEYKGHNSFIGYIKAIIRSNSDDKNAENLISRWSKILIDMFLNCEDFDNLKETKESELKDALLFSEKKLNILKSIEIIGQIYPESITEIYPHIIVYLKDFSIIKSDVIINICTVLSYILPLVKSMNTKSIEMDLLKIVMDSKSPQLIRSSILCLTSLVGDNSKENYVNENNIITPIIMESIRNLWEYKCKIEADIGSFEVKALDSIRRNAWLLGCIYEYSSPKIALTFLNNKIERAKIIETEFGISWALYNDKCDSMSDSKLGTVISVDYNVIDSSNFVFDLLCDLFYSLDWNLNKSILFPTLIQFLMNQKQFIKTVKFNTLIRSALRGVRIKENYVNKLKSSDTENSMDNDNLNIAKRSGLCIISLQGIFSLLKNYEYRAIKENKSNQYNDDLLNNSTTDILEAQSNEHSNNIEENTYGSRIYNTPNNRSSKSSKYKDQFEPYSPVSSSTFSNVENLSTVKTNILGSTSQNTTSSSASQPLASNLDILLSLFQETTTENVIRFNKVQKQQISSLILCILELFNKHGLVNPTSIIPPISGLLFSINKEISYKSYQIICSMFDRFPNLIMNKYKEITINGFIYYYSNVKNMFGVYSKEDSDSTLKYIFTKEIAEENIQGKTRSEFLGITFEYFSRIYVEKCRGKKVYRESFIKGFCKQFELLLSIDEVKCLLNKLSSNINMSNKALLMLYIEFVSYLILALPFIYESELLLLLYNLGEICVSCSQNCNNIHETSEIIDELEMKIYSNAILVITCTSLQKILKEEYNVDESHISNFNPYNSIHKEKPKYSHLDVEFQANTNEGVTNIISLNRNKIYESMGNFREKLFNIWELSSRDSSTENLVEFVNEILYLNAHTTTEKVTKPGKKKLKKKSVKRSRDEDQCSDTNSSQSWSPT
ncbi:hypothetical protein FG386_000906 [Cryptosporidium ryanae]|uniref:uncharacterized protein n=1 Tax=Cryptosporidium ryanae TaxID=515981 RepID=UPI00351A1E29|nr:hypothetical protein FG386_000906 [Cryptosporidium ryanae]